MKLLRFAAMTALISALFGFAHGEPIAVGADAPKISAVTETGETIHLADVYSKGYTLIYFYPKANTPGCTAQGCSLRDAYETLTQRGVTVIGVSTDSVEAQKKFKAEQRFPFTLIADTDKKVMRAFGQDGIMFASRQAFLIDRNGKVIWRDLKASTKKQADDVLAALQSLEK
jgi:peroxiredoxin Q/BCP